MPQNFDIKTTFRAVDKSTQAISKIQNRLMKLTANGSMAMRRLDRTMSRVSKTLTTGIRRGAFLAAAGITALAGATWKVMQQFSKIEDAEAAFTPLLGGAKKATEMVAALNETAATTPFQFENLAGAAKQLLPNMGGDITRTIELIRMLGDTAGGNAQKMDSIVRGYNKALLKGKVDMESLNMIAEAGVPIFNDLGTVVGKSGTKLFKAISAGKISTEDLTKAFQKMTGEGGIFFEGMKIASETLSGKVSTLKDVVGLATAELGGALAPALKDVTDDLIKVAQQARQWVIANKELIKTKFAEFIKKIPDYLEKIVYWGPKIAYLVGTFYAISGAIKIANVAMMIFNAVAAANPITLIVIAVIAAIAAIIIFRKEICRFIVDGIKWMERSLKSASEAIQAFFEDPMPYIIKAVTFLKDIVTDVLIPHIIEAFVFFKDTVIDILKGTVEVFWTIGKTAWSAIRETLGLIGDLLVGNWESAEQRLIGIWTRIKNAAKRILDPIVDVIRTVLDFIGYYEDEKQAGYFKHQERNITKYGNNGDSYSDGWSLQSQSVNVVRPSVSLSRSETSHKEEMEVTIQDKTGRAQVTKGSSGRLKLVHTGGMP